jgi:hypothetical protein
VQVALKQRDKEVSRLNGELTQLSVSHEDLRQEVEEGEAQAGSLMASRLRTLGGHVTRRMRCALHLGVQ